MSKIKYGLSWGDDVDDLRIELYMIAKGGVWTGSNGTKFGLGLFEHHKNAQKLLWPDDDWHRWVELTLRAICENKITTIIGPGSSGKTYIASKFALVDYWAAPNETCILISSTDVRGLELRVWGRIKDLLNRAVDRYPDLPGTVLESMHAIATDDIDEDERARVLNRGIICIPCLQSGRYVGLAKYLGIKQKRLRLIADECQAMGSNFLDATSNLGSNPDAKFVFLGNPNDPLDPLGLAAEPLDGWSSMPEPTTTTSWKTRFQNGICVNLVGTDSPNNDFPDDNGPKFPYLIHRKRIEEIAAFWTTDSQQYYSQAVGVMKTGLLARRVITRDLCVEHHALDKAVWSGGEIKKVYAIDAAYSGTGGDRCVAGFIEYGKDIDGTQIIKVNPPSIIPISIRINKSPEDQIAEYVQKDIGHNSIPASDVFYDSTGRGTLGSAFARLFKDVTPVPVEFGGKPSKRPVRHDLFVFDGQEKRHKRCDEHFLDFVSELWLCSRYIIECDQLRELPDDVMKEGCQREYGRHKNKEFVESKHDPKARERMIRSPDLYDWLVTACEGARQRGFKIMRLGSSGIVESDPYRWLADRRKSAVKLLESKSLSFK